MPTRIRPVILFFVLVVCAALLFAADSPQYDPLPATVSNNAVAGLHSRGQLLLFTFMGIGAKKTWDAVTNDAYILGTETGKWAQARSVPGPAGRLAAAAAGARDHVFLFGGYVVDGQGGEHTLPDVNVYEPIGDRWSRAADIPVPVDDFVIGLHRDRLIYLVGGWSKDNPVSDVQVYDSEKNVWMKATPIPGTPVFGHAGGMAGDTIVYVDGAYRNPAGNPKFIASDQCWMGKVHKKDPTKIDWTKLPPHPGPARYRIAAGGSDKDDRIYFSGGTDNPYNYNGIGYDGKPSQPSPVTFAFNIKTAKWETINDKTPNPTMDHRGLIVGAHSLVLIGGMNANQEPTAKVVLIPKQPKPNEAK